MDVRCDKCGTEYEFDDARVGGQGVTVKCTNCGFVFKVHKESTRASRDWLVRKADNQIIAFRQLTTLQKWIVEGRIDRKDEISRNGETWKRLGNIGELEPFFSVFDKAQALNDLMSTGSIGARPVMVNGSEILATMNPLAPPSGAAAPPGLVDVPVVDVPSLVPEPLTPRVRRSTLPPPAAPPAGLALGRMASSVARPGALEDNTVRISAPTARLESLGGRIGAGPGPMGETDASSRITEPPPAPPAAPAGRTNGEARLFHGAPPTSTGLAGPGALGAELTQDLALSTPPELRPRNESSEIVRSFRRERRARRMTLAAFSLLLVGLGGGAAFAVLGPTEDNPLRRLLEKYRVLPTAGPVDDHREKLELAYRDFELDTEASLHRAERAFAEIAELRPNEAGVRADRALVLITHADALRRAAAHKDQRVRQHRAELQRHQETVARETALAERRGVRPNLPSPPAPLDEPALEAAARAERERASTLLKTAFEEARQAHALAPNALETARALAEYYRVQRDQQGLSARHLEAAKAATRAAGTGDAATKYIEAATLVGSGRDAPPSQLLAATHLLEEALTMRPTMLRARVLLARVLMLRQQTELAKAELDKIARAAPEHAEAPALLAELEEQRAPAPAPAPAPVAPTTAEPSPAPEGAAPATTPTPKTAPIAEPTPQKASPAKPVGPKVTEIDQEEAASRPYQDWIALGDRLRRAGDAKGALAAYEKAADRRVNAPQAYAGMGWSYLDQGKTVAGLNAFKKALTLNARFPEGHLGLGVAHRKLGRRGDAMAAYRAYLDLSPEGGEAIAARRTLEQLEAEERAVQAAQGRAAGSSE